MNEARREKKLIINSILYFFGSLGKGVASIIVVFIGSFFIDPSQMGVYDLVTATITLIQPIIIFQINDGIYRWLLDDSISREDTIRCGYAIVFRNLFIANLIILFFIHYFSIQYKELVIILVNINCIYPVYQQITRGLKSHRVFAVSGIVNAVLILSISTILLLFTDLQIGSFYLAQIIANTSSVVYLIIAQNLPVDFWKKPNNSTYSLISKPMQRYSILLVPNTINQWIMKALDKYCILYILTSYYNGIYTIAHRFPDIVIMANNMFYSAWVEQSIVEYDSPDRDEYFSKIFNIYASFFITTILMIIPVTKYFITFFVGIEYHSAFKYVPLLYIAVIFNGFSSFIGTGYLGTKKTEGIMWTSFFGAVVNIVINVVFMPKLGLQIAGISSICAYLGMFLLRLLQTKKFFCLKIDWKRIISLILLAFIIAFLVQRDSMIIDCISEIIVVIVFFVVNHKYLKKINI